jgi:hypothetical protein
MMWFPFLFRLFLCCFFVVPVLAQAAAQTPEDPYANLTDFSGLSPEQIRTRILDACVVRIASENPAQDDSFATRCACYAGRIVTAMTEPERDHLRRTGAFIASAQTKAETALSACKVRAFQRR